MLKQIKHTITLIGLFFSLLVAGQTHIGGHQLNILYNKSNQRLNIHQKIIFYPNKQNIDSLFMINWVNAYKHKQTPLAQRFIENYELNFHFTSKKNRGKIIIEKIFINNKQMKSFLKNYLNDEFFVLPFPKKLSGLDSIEIKIDYQIQLPKNKFTGFGIDKDKNITLENFYFLPVEKKYLYANKNIDDYFEFPTNFFITLKNFPPSKKIFSNLNHKNDTILYGHLKNPVILITDKPYESYKIENKEVVIPSNNKIKDKDTKIKLLTKIYKYIQQELGDYPQNKLIISKKDLKNNKVYGPDLLPDFIRPFSDTLIYEIELLHQITHKYITAKYINKRKQSWIALGIPSYIEYKYLNHYYPDLKLLGKIATYKLIKFYYASQIKLNEKYPWLYLYVTRMNKDQSLNTSLDSLTNFNRNVASPYKATLGLVMLSDEYEKKIFKKQLKNFYQSNKLLNDSLFYYFFKIKEKNNWFDDYINTRIKYDYKLSKIKIKNDSLFLTIKKKLAGKIPLHIYGIKNDSIYIIKKLIALQHDTILAINHQPTYQYIGINYFNNYPEYQIKNNYKRLGKHLLKKPLQIRPYQDFDNPLKTQIFINPFFEYNYYDGVIIGSQIMNESFLHNDFFYSLTPSYASKTNSLTGSFSINHSYYFNNYKPYAIKYGVSFKYYHYKKNLSYKRFNPFFTIKFRHKYIRKRKGSDLNFQLMHINKESNIIAKISDRYSIFNLYYKGFDINIIKDFFYKTDLQIASKFGKISGMLRYRYLSNKNRQWDFRIYAGTFLYNKTNSHYFSFALDRPTDYLFQHNYYGRSETSGIFHQQFIWAEGGFKTFFNNQFANQFIISNNVNIGIWKWFNFYTDWAWKKNKNEKINFYYDTGIRINLVQDYFEIFFPMYSKLGWEIKEKDYLQRIRLVFVMNLHGIFKMIRRGWY